MKKRMMFFALALVTVFFTHETAFAQRGGRAGETIEVRLASPMPRNSDWGRTLDRMAAEWARATGNTVRLRILHDGVEGGDSKMLSSLSTDNIQAALLSSFGMADICPAVMTLSVPFLIRNDDEFEQVMREIQPILEDQINRTNFVVIAWSRGGSVNVFSRDPVFVPDDLRRHRLATAPDATDLNTTFRTMGFHLVETEGPDLGTRIVSNMINALYQNPVAIAPLQLHNHLNHMLDIPIGRFVGAIVMNRVTWNRLNPDQQRAVSTVTQRIADEFDTAMPRTVANAVSAMQRDGLRVNRLNSVQESLWQTEMNSVIPSLLGTTFDREVFQRINEIVEVFRGGR